MITSKLTSRAQTTIPLPVRNALRLGEGDEIADRIEGDQVILTKGIVGSPLIRLRSSMNGRLRPIDRRMAIYDLFFACINRWNR